MIMFGWGRNSDFQLGLGKPQDEHIPVEINTSSIHPTSSLRSISCGSGHSLFLFEDGEIFACGRGDDGRLGINDLGWCQTPRKLAVFSPKRIISIGCGSYHSAFVAEDGSLFTVGGGLFGKLMLGDSLQRESPCLVSALRHKFVKKVALGSRHTLALLDNGMVWSSGHGVTNGHGPTSADVETPRIIYFFASNNIQIKDIAACGFHSLALDTNGWLYSFGENQFGRLGHGNEISEPTPKRIETLANVPIAQIACGGFHSLATSLDGILYGFGGNEHGQLGLDHRMNCFVPTIVETLRPYVVSLISAGWSHSSCVLEDGRMFSCGNNDRGKLGITNATNTTIFQPVERLQGIVVKSLSTYNEHSFVLCDVQYARPLLHHQISSSTSSSVLSSMGSSVHFNSNNNNTLMNSSSLNQSSIILNNINLNNNSNNNNINNNVIPLVPGNSLIHDFRSMVNSELFSDVTFLFEDDIVNSNDGCSSSDNRNKIFAHKNILCARSHHFRCMFLSGMMESTLKEILLKDVSYDAFLQVIHWIYTDGVDLSLFNMEDVKFLSSNNNNNNKNQSFHNDKILYQDSSIASSASTRIIDDIVVGNNVANAGAAASSLSSSSSSSSSNSYDENNNVARRIQQSGSEFDKESEVRKLPTLSPNALVSSSPISNNKNNNHESSATNGSNDDFGVRRDVADFVVEVYMVADLYGLDGLRRLVEAICATQMSANTAPAILLAADLQNARPLRENALKFILRNFDLVSKSNSFKILSRELILEILSCRIPHPPALILRS